MFYILQVRFCSVACRDQASYHGMECGLSDFLDAANLGKHGLLALRTAARVGYRTLMDVAAMSAHRSDPQEVVYDSSDYLTIFNLIANTDQRSVADLFRRTVMALYLATATTWKQWHRSSCGTCRTTRATPTKSRNCVFRTWMTT